MESGAADDFHDNDGDTNGLNFDHSCSTHDDVEDDDDGNLQPDENSPLDLSTRQTRSLISGIDFVSIDANEQMGTNKLSVADEKTRVSNETINGNFHISFHN